MIRQPFFDHDFDATGASGSRSMMMRSGWSRASRFAPHIGNPNTPIFTSPITAGSE